MKGAVLLLQFGMQLGLAPQQLYFQPGLPFPHYHPRTLSVSLCRLVLS